MGSALARGEALAARQDRGSRGDSVRCGMRANGDRTGAGRRWLEAGTRTWVGRPRGERVSSAEPGGHGVGLASFVRQGTGRAWAHGRQRQSARGRPRPPSGDGGGQGSGAVWRSAFGDIVGAARVKLDIRFFFNYTIQHVFTLTLMNRCKPYPYKHWTVCI